jgi:hypothetical protein
MEMSLNDTEARLMWKCHLRQGQRLGRGAADVDYANGVSPNLSFW